MLWFLPNAVPTDLCEDDFVLQIGLNLASARFLQTFKVRAVHSGSISRTVKEKDGRELV